MSSYCQIKQCTTLQIQFRLQNGSANFDADKLGADLFFICNRFAGAGLFDSVQACSPSVGLINLAADPLWTDRAFQLEAIHKISAASIAVEDFMGAPQDIEGALDKNGRLYILQTRPQVGL